MIPVVRRGGRVSSMAPAVAVGICVLLGSWDIASGGGFGGHHGRRGLGVGTLGYGPPGPRPGFYGFGLSYHLGYGYGGYGLGVGADGGYPCYGGPGYPHGDPCLRRFGKITPFPYAGGRGEPNHFERTGPLVVRRPVVTLEGDGRDFVPDGDYGSSTGTLPYPDSFFAPYAGAAAATGSARP